jgi:2-acylglycerol O-acyltransferase 2
MSWLSSTSATKSVLMKNMNAGNNLYILPGGVSEIFLACPGVHVIKAPRRGLMKLALQTGAVLVPTYVFGANAFFNQSATYGSSSNKRNTKDRAAGPTNLIGKIQRRISRTVRGGFTLFWGQYGLPLPYEVNCSMVLGDPIEPIPGTLGQESSGGKMTCRKIEEPSETQIDELLFRYTDALVRLFEQYKAQAGVPNAQLTFE